MARTGRINPDINPPEMTTRAPGARVPPELREMDSNVGAPVNPELIDQMTPPTSPSRSYLGWYIGAIVVLTVLIYVLHLFLY